MANRSNRPSPPFPAKDFKYKQKKGKDGNTYKSLPDKNKRFRWVLVKKTTSVTRKGKTAASTKKTKTKGKKYGIHDNGARPFLVDVMKNKVNIYKKSNIEDINGPYDKLVKSITSFDKVFIGKDPEYHFHGNSILIRIASHSYIYIGSEIYSFKTKDEIVSYLSPVGNSDVPYPFAVGTQYTYLMVADVKIPNDQRTTDDPYRQFYDLKRKDQIYTRKKYGFSKKIIHKRLW